MRIQPSFGARLLQVRVRPEDDFRTDNHNYVDLALRTMLPEPGAESSQGYTTVNPHLLGVNPFPASGIPMEPRLVLRGERLMLTPQDQAEIEKRTAGKPWTEREKVLRDLWERAKALPVLNLVIALRKAEPPNDFEFQLTNHAELNGVNFESPPLAKASG